MKDFAMRVYNYQEKTMNDVIGIYGLDGSNPRIQTKVTSLDFKANDVMFHFGFKDSKHERIFDKDVLRYELKNKEGKSIRVVKGVAIFNTDKCRLEFTYAEEVEDKKTGEMVNKPVTICDVEWSRSRIIGNSYFPPPSGIPKI